MACSAVIVPVHAAIRLSKDWGPSFYPDGRLIPKTQHDDEKLTLAVTASASSRNAAREGDGPRGDPEYGLGFKLYLNDELYYVNPARFMQKTRPDEVCHIKNFVNMPTYQCQEGQRYTVACHLGVYDKQFKELGWHTIQIKESYPVYCNADIALGVLDKSQNDLLMTVQYFSVDRQAASKVSQIGSGWVRMTVRLKLRKAEGGHMLIEQDDACLGNPNKLDTIADARRALRQCDAEAAANLTKTH
jgi:hypothetical protein